METIPAFDPAIYEEIAEQLNIDLRTLERESLRTYLEQKLAILKAEQFRVTGKYNIKTVEEMEQLYRKQQLAEKDSWEDFFDLDHIEAEIDVIERALAKI